MTTIGFIGAGNIGINLARAAIKQGYSVVLSNSRGPQTLVDRVAELGPSARAATAERAAADADVGVVCIPTRNLSLVPVHQFAGKIVIDTNNYYPERDGRIPSIDEERTTVSQMLQAHLSQGHPPAHVVKAFNHIQAALIGKQARDAGAADRRALAIFADSQPAAAWVTSFVDQLGFDPVFGGPLDESWRIERGTPGYDARLSGPALLDALAQADRAVVHT